MPIYNLYEARNKKFTYEEVPKLVSKPNIIDRVIVHLESKDSEQFTKIAKRFARAKRIKDMLAKEEKSLKKELRERVEALFDESDKWYMRVVQTASLVFKMSRYEERTTTDFDEEGYLAKLEELTGFTEEQLRKIQEEFTTVTEYKVDSKVYAPTAAPKRKAKSKTKESVELTENIVLDKLSKFIETFTRYLKTAGQKWDKEFEQLQTQMAKDGIPV